MQFKNEAVLTCLTKKKYKAYTPALSSLQIYCDKYNLDLHILKNPKYSPRTFFDKFYFYELLQTYHRVLVLDSDILISPKAPNIFNVYADYSKFYALNLNNDDEEFNEGVFIVSRDHMDKFKTFQTRLLYTDKKLSLENKSYLNKVVKRQNINISPIDKKFNYICKPDVNDVDRFKSYFIHYENIPDKIKWMTSDFHKLYS